ncbi:uncharacterized protein BDZ83DRAFT_605232 [Colletotrichum acutatum]|uniref:Uncharacterized protein n=1 Tax=Glomerella acutata TaxID=27357 RepID=A0AAD8XLC6_GLOAC|nr:uncharacterized protein BDZ83DRAFT_605232 [Colletotrichum acutatum]KAK1729477.1 hypothetical protein BDZ83DRAFT_605232 [Colletotrichum acutatum]
MYKHQVPSNRAIGTTLPVSGPQSGAPNLTFPNVGSGCGMGLPAEASSPSKPILPVDATPVSEVEFKPKSQTSTYQSSLLDTIRYEDQIT